MSVAQEGQPLAARGRRRDGVASLFQPGRDVRSLGRVVVDQQDPRAGGMAGAGGAAGVTLILEEGGSGVTASK